MTNPRAITVGLAIALAGACSVDLERLRRDDGGGVDGGMDAGGTDGGGIDAGSTDTGVGDSGEADAATSDAGETEDAGDSRCPGGCDDDNACTIDMCAADGEGGYTCAYLNRADGTSCDDGVSCTSGDACDGGDCVGAPDCPTNEVCDASADECVCDSGFDRCDTTCIPTASCCIDDDCTGGKVCSSGGSCVCPSGTRNCGGTCVCAGTGGGECCPDQNCFNCGSCGAISVFCSSSCEWPDCVHG